MRRISLAVLVALCACMGLAPSVSAAPHGDRVSGFGVRAPSCPDCMAGSFGFDVTSGPNGENPIGWYTTTFEGYASFTGAVTCVDVHGKWATLYGQITTGTGAADPTTYTQDQEPLYFVVVVHGLGRPHRGSPAKDQMSLTAWDTEANYLTESGLTLAQICTDPYTAIGSNAMLNLVAGDIRVKDRHGRAASLVGGRSTQKSVER